MRLQVVQALLTAVTEARVNVHDAALLQAVRVVFNICVSATDPVNETTARAALSQIVRVVFLRMAAAVGDDYGDAAEEVLVEVAAATGVPAVELAKAVESAPVVENGTTEVQRPSFTPWFLLVSCC